MPILRFVTCADYNIGLMVERPQANDIGIDPPATTLVQQNITEEVCEPRNTTLAKSIFVSPDSRSIENFICVFEDGPGRNIGRGVVHVKVVFVPVGKKRSNTELFHDGKGRPNPQ